ncbi:MAG: hypothetical protein MR210_03465 [Erysipelotrichaceae bacterium]|nr:hypothetical protein [Erysipelotrichaceae bacterium]MDY5251260.1 hypothetical protein [Erysipelotrichaceae bacterium]
MEEILAFICSLTMIFTVILLVNAKNSVEVDITYLLPTLEEYIVTYEDALVAEEDKLYVTMTQYHNKESYYPSYNDSY